MKLKNLLKEIEIDKSNAEMLKALKLAIKAYKELGLSKKQSAYKVALRAIFNAE